MAKPGKNNAEYFSSSQVIVADGLSLHLIPSSKHSGYSYEGGVISSYGKFDFVGGYLEVIAKMPDVRTGGWPAIWLLPGPDGAHGDAGEIDLFEGGYLPRGVNLPSATPVNQVVTSQYHQVSGETTDVAAIDAGVDLTAAYHSYGIEYRPGISIKTYFDGRLVGHFTEDVGSDPYQLIINNSQASDVTRDWHTTGRAATPSVLSVKEVAVYAGVGER